MTRAEKIQLLYAIAAGEISVESLLPPRFEAWENHPEKPGMCIEPISGRELSFEEIGQYKPKRGMVINWCGPENKEPDF